MNHRLNAQVHNLPKCFECGAAERTPCTTIPGGAIVREPHNIRTAVASGRVAIVERPAGRAARELAETVRSLRKQWGIAEPRRKRAC